MTARYHGRCLCGGVRFGFCEVAEPPMACHCLECQRHSGGVGIAVTVPVGDLSVEGRSLGWVSASPRAWRGFCRDCGGYLFWQPAEGKTVDVAFGALEEANGLRLTAHIFCEEARLPIPEDGLPRFPRGRPGTD